MPRTTREYALRYAEQTIGNLDRAIDDLKKLRDLYGPGYEQYQQYCDMQAQLIMTAKENMEIFKKNYM